jgi:hypothetical protein
MIETKTYHVDAFGLPNVTLPTGILSLKHTRHSSERAEQKGIVVPRKIDMRDFTVLEVTTFLDKLVKIVVRGSYDLDNDICLAISVYYGENVVKSVWTNNKLDTHISLNKSKYERI